MSTSNLNPKFRISISNPNIGFQSQISIEKIQSQISIKNLNYKSHSKTSLSIPNLNLESQFHITLK
jgi:hypothetical protein